MKDWEGQLQDLIGLPLIFLLVLFCALKHFCILFCIIILTYRILKNQREFGNKAKRSSLAYMVFHIYHRYQHQYGSLTLLQHIHYIQAYYISIIAYFSESMNDSVYDIVY